MICESCHGTGKAYAPVHRQNGNIQTGEIVDAVEFPCPACNGSGIASCCDGAVGGPEDIP